jgi:hypothetical protein
VGDSNNDLQTQIEDAVKFIRADLEKRLGETVDQEFIIQRTMEAFKGPLKTLIERRNQRLAELMEQIEVKQEGNFICISSPKELYDLLDISSTYEIK